MKILIGLSLIVSFSVMAEDIGHVIPGETITSTKVNEVISSINNNPSICYIYVEMNAGVSFQGVAGQNDISFDSLIKGSCSFLTKKIEIEDSRYLSGSSFLEFSLKKGVYDIYCQSGAYETDHTRVELFNTTLSIAELKGSLTYAGSYRASPVLIGNLLLDSDDSSFYKIQQYIERTGAGQKQMGNWLINGDITESNIHSQCRITKIR